MRSLFSEQNTRNYSSIHQIDIQLFAAYNSKEELGKTHP
jgi:hypothetical protein